MDLHTYYRYLPTAAEDKLWGISVPTTGYAWIPKNSTYPPVKHPDGYSFDWKRGRVLQEFQLLYISRGQGKFESKETGKVTINAGQAFLLFPGVWHRYTPCPETGWDEYWIGFDGDLPRRLASKGIFSPTAAIFSPGLNAGMGELFSQVSQALQKESSGYRATIAGIAFNMLAKIHCITLGENRSEAVSQTIIQKSRLLIMERLYETINWEDLAKELNVSYSLLRHYFKLHTGFSLYQYQIQLRLEKAKELLSGTSHPIKEITSMIGFNCPYHFSTLFKRKTGSSPLAWRKSTNPESARGKGL